MDRSILLDRFEGLGRCRGAGSPGDLTQHLNPRGLASPLGQWEAPAEVEPPTLYGATARAAALAPRRPPDEDPRYRR